MRAALFLHVGTKHLNKPGGNDQTPENQFLRLREFATEMGWTIAAEFADRESGAQADRTQFHAVLAAASKREFDVVLVCSLDRFSGDGICKTLQHLNTLGGYGVDFRSFSEPFIDTTSEFGPPRLVLSVHKKGTIPANLPHYDQLTLSPGLALRRVLNPQLIDSSAPGISKGNPVLLSIEYQSAHFEQEVNAR